MKSSMPMTSLTCLLGLGGLCLVGCASGTFEASIIFDLGCLNALQHRLNLLMVWPSSGTSASDQVSGGVFKTLRFLAVLGNTGPEHRRQRNMLMP